MPAGIHQVDVEMSFARPTRSRLVEPLMQLVFKEIGREITVPFGRISFADAMATYGSTSRTFDSVSRFAICQTAFVTRVSRLQADCRRGGVVRGFAVPGGNKYSRSQLDVLVEQAKQLGFTGLIWVPPWRAAALFGEGTERSACGPR